MERTHVAWLMWKQRIEGGEGVRLTIARYRGQD